MKNKNKKKLNLLIFSHNNDYNIKIFDKLSQKIKKKIIVTNIITVDKKNIKSLNESFKYSKTILRDDLIKEKTLNLNKIFKNKNLKKFYKCKDIFFKMLDFTKLDDSYFTTEEKKDAFSHYLKIVLNYLYLNKIDVVFFSHVPHNFFEVLFIQVCKIKNIKIIFTRAYLLPGFYLFETDLFFTSLQKENNRNSEYLNPGLVDFFKEAKKKFDLLNIKKNIWLDYSLIFNLSNQNRISKFFFTFFCVRKYLNFFLRKILIIFKLFITFFTDSFKKNQYQNLKNYYFIDDFHKEKKSTLMNSNLNKFILEKIYLKTDIKKFKLLRDYLRLSSKVNLNDNFIFFPLWFQPSSTTYPFGGKLIDYIKCVKILSKSLPKNWKIFIKESPDIFNMNKHAWFKGTYTRNKKFYSKLKKIKGVYLVNYEIPDYKLIDSCKATATHADKFGLISILRNKPNINFSNSIQRYCHGTFICKNLRDIKTSIIKIQNGFKINKKKLYIFFSILSKKLFYRETIKGFNKYETKTEYSKISKLLENELNKSF